MKRLFQRSLPQKSAELLDKCVAKSAPELITAIELLRQRLSSQKVLAEFNLFNRTRNRQNVLERCSILVEALKKPTAPVEGFWRSLM